VDGALPLSPAVGHLKREAAAGVDAKRMPIDDGGAGRGLACTSALGFWYAERVLGPNFDYLPAAPSLWSTYHHSCPLAPFASQ